jgi:WD40 repeat protein
MTIGTAGLHRLEFALNQRTLIAYARAISVYDDGSGQMLSRFTDPYTDMSAGCLSTDQSRMLTAGEDNSFKLWDAVSSKTLMEFDITGGTVQQTCISGDGRVIAAASDSGVISVWDTHFTGDKCPVERK